MPDTPPWTLPSKIGNTTISGNTATDTGGGVYNGDGLTRIEYSTITNNTAPNGMGSGVESFGEFNTFGFTDVRTEVFSTIVSANPGTDVDLWQFVEPGFPPPPLNNSFVSEVYNLIGDGAATGTFNQKGDQIDVSDPGLDPLGSYGGPTQTHSLQPDSPAVDAGPPSTSCRPFQDTDQRSVERPQDGNNDGEARCDIGSFEAVSNKECQPSGSDVVCTFTFNPLPLTSGSAYGQAQYWTVPEGVTQATFAVSGAQGGSDRLSGIPAGGLGGKASATIAVTPGNTLQVNVGGRGGDTREGGTDSTGGQGAAGGFNGGLTAEAPPAALASAPAEEAPPMCARVTSSLTTGS